MSGRGIVLILLGFLFWVPSAFPGDEFPCPAPYRFLIPDKSITAGLKSGDTVEIQRPGESAPRKWVFGGRVVRPGGQTSAGIFYDRENDTFHSVPWAEIEFHAAGGGKIEEGKVGAVVSAAPLVGGVKTASAVYHVFLQLKTDGKLPAKAAYGGLEHEPNRYSFLANLFGRIHGRGGPQMNLESAVRASASELGVPVRRLSGWANKLQPALDKELAAHNPVILDFQDEYFVSQSVSVVVNGTGPFKASSVVPTVNQPGRSLWASLFSGPRPLNPQHHQVVILRAFDGPGGKKRYLVLDPLMVEPEIWDGEVISRIQGNGVQAFALGARP